MVERGRWQASLAIRLMSAPLAERLVWVLLFEHPLHESARFDQSPVSEPVYHTPLLGGRRPSGRTEGDIRRGQGNLGAHVARWRGLGSTRTT